VSIAFRLVRAGSVAIFQESRNLAADCGTKYDAAVSSIQRLKQFDSFNSTANQPFVADDA